MADTAAAPAVDTHAHIFDRAAMPFAADAHSRPAYDYRVADYLADLDRHGIARGVIAAASLFDDANAYTLAALAAHPDRLRATVLLPPETDAATLARLAAAGVVGVRLQWRRHAAYPDLDAEPWRGFLARLAAAGLHVELLAGGAALPALLPGFARSGVALVLDHFGVPPRDPAERRAGLDAIARAVALGRTWVKLSAGFRIDPPIAAEAAARLLVEAGPERLFWGSDAPFVNHEAHVDFAAVLALFAQLVPDPATRAAIDASARRFFFNEGTPP